MTTAATSPKYGHDLPPPAKPKLSAQERRTREADRLTAIRLRVTIGQELENRGIEDPAEIGAALGMRTLEATKLLTQHQWREGDVACLKAAAARPGVDVPGLTDQAKGEGGAVTWLRQMHHETWWRNRRFLFSNKDRGGAQCGAAYCSRQRLAFH